MNNDLISKSDLIEKIKDYIQWFGHPEKVECANQIIELIQHQPTEEKPQGEWVFLKANEEQTDGYECSVCKKTYHTRVPYFSEFNFCPNCGAKMKQA